MEKNNTKFPEENEKLKKEIINLQQQLREAREAIDLIKTGSIDALVVTHKKDVKVYTDKTSDKIYRILIEKMHEGALTLDEDGTILYCNSCFANMVSLPLQKAIGASLCNFIEDSSKERFKALLKQGRDNYISDEVFIKGKDGKIMPASMSVNILSLDTNFVLSIILTDLTVPNESREKLERRAKQIEQKNKEIENKNKELAFQIDEKEKRAAELRIANKELVVQNEEKEKRAMELMIANKELEQFTYVASHDLQEPLRTALNYMQVFEEDHSKLLDDNALKCILLVKAATKRMSVLIKSLLDFSRLGHNAKSKYVDCKKLINNVISDLDTLIKTSNAVIEVTEMPKLNVYEIEIGHVFHNLITNAIKFHKKDTRPEIKIYSQKINEQWQFSVSDNGIGIDPIYFEKIFNIFQRLNSQKEYEGTGIGLANCKKIIHLHQGEIRVESQPGRGATFHFTLSDLTG